MIVTVTPPKTFTPPFASQIRKSVVFIQVSCKRGDQVVTETGTGFFLAYPDPRLQSGQTFVYLVTNRHVAECWDEHAKPSTVISTLLRANGKNGLSVVIPIQQISNDNWHFSSDDSADAAVLSVSPNDLIDDLLIPTDMAATRDYLRSNFIGEGSKIVLSGFFYQWQGDQKIEPIVREGILSMIPDEPMMTTANKRGNLYLGEVHIFGGNSGSPVFVAINGWVPGPVLKTDEYHLLGIVSGYYFEDSDFKLQIATTVSGTQHSNSGISMIVPADYLLDIIIKDPVLKSYRDAFFAAHPQPAK